VFPQSKRFPISSVYVLLRTDMQVERERQRQTDRQTDRQTPDKS